MYSATSEMAEMEKVDRYHLSWQGFDMADLSADARDIEFWTQYAVNMASGTFMDEREKGLL